MSLSRLEQTQVRSEIQINFAAPAALNTDVVGVDQDTGVNFFQPRGPNTLLDVKHTADPAAGLLFTVFIRRQQLSRARIGTTGDFLVAFNGRIRPNMPKAIRAGFYQWVEQQNAGALTLQNYIITLAAPLSI